MDMDNSVVIVVQRGIKGLNGNGENTIKKKKDNTKYKINCLWCNNAQQMVQL